MLPLSLPLKSFRLFSPTNLFLLGIFLVLSFLLYSGYDSLLSKLGLETKASVKAQLAVANTHIATLQQSNQQFKQQLLDQEERHQKEVKYLEQVAEQERQTTKLLAQTKLKLEQQASTLKKQIQAKQQETYAKYNLSETQYYIYPKEEINQASSNNYDSIYNFLTTIPTPPPPTTPIIGLE